MADCPAAPSERNDGPLAATGLPNRARFCEELSRVADQPDRSAIVAERILQVAAAQRVPVGDRHPAISCSIGIAMIEPADVGRLAMNEVLHQADLAMYAAKKLGRSAWQAYPGDGTPPAVRTAVSRGRSSYVSPMRGRAGHRKNHRVASGSGPSGVDRVA